VSTPNILATKSEGGLLPYCKIGAKSEGNNRPGPLVSSQAEVAYLPLLGYAKTVGISSYSKRQLCLRRLWANEISHVPQFLFGFFFKKKVCRVFEKIWYKHNIFLLQEEF
jgi:hypothetical protein